MPLTIAHPCAVLPFAKLCPRYLNFAALVCGSMSPDLAYAFQQYQFSAQAHTFAGSLFLDLLTGLLLLLIYYYSKDLIASQLPAPHREYWLSLPGGSPLGKPIGNTKFSLLLILSALATLSLTLFQNMFGVSQSLAHQGFVLVVNCMFMLPVVFLISGLIERSQRR